MKKIMLLLFSFAKIEDVIEKVENTIDENTEELHLTFFQKKDVPDTLSSLMGVYLGEKIQKDVQNTILKEYFRMKEEVTYRFTEIAEKNNFKVKNKLFRGYSSDQIYNYIHENEIEYLIVNYFKNEFNSQKVYNDIEKEFLETLDVKYKLYKHSN
jgi:hypothetical protein